jgi:hypothetical protein
LNKIISIPAILRIILFLNYIKLLNDYNNFRISDINCRRIFQFISFFLTYRANKIINQVNSYTVNIIVNLNECINIANDGREVAANSNDALSTNMYGNGERYNYEYQKNSV